MASGFGDATETDNLWRLVIWGKFRELDEGAAQRKQGRAGRILGEEPWFWLGIGLEPSFGWIDGWGGFFERGFSFSL